MRLETSWLHINWNLELNYQHSSRNSFRPAISPELYEPPLDALENGAIECVSKWVVDSITETEGQVPCLRFTPRERTT
jgi:hypothetical protein